MGLSSFSASQSYPKSIFRDHDETVGGQFDGIRRLRYFNKIKMLQHVEYHRFRFHESKSRPLKLRFLRWNIFILYVNSIY